MIPKVVAENVFFFFNKADLEKTHRVSKEFYSLSQNELKSYTTRLPAGEYFAVGEKVVISRETNLFLDREYPYTKLKEKIPLAEISKAIPTGKIKLFKSQEEAEDYAFKTSKDSDRGMGFAERSPIFKVKLSEPKILSTIQEDVSYLRFPWSDKEKTASVSYVTTDVNNLEFISGQMPGYKEEYSLQTKQDNCLVM